MQQRPSDVVDLLDHLRVEQAHFCAISMGGLTGMALALGFPHRMDRLVLAKTAARIGSAESWSERIKLVRGSKLDSLASQFVDRRLTPAYRYAEPGLTQVLVDSLRRTGDQGYEESCAALRDADLRDQIARIAVPTMVIAGRHDMATTPA